MQRKRKLATTLGTALLIAAALPLGSQVDAADHRDAPGTDGTMSGDRFADINDLYAWHTDNDTIVVVLTFNGLHAPDAPVTDYLDPAETPNVLYTVHIDNDSAAPADWTDQDPATYGSDIQINIKFGQNMLEEWGVQIENLPGAGETLVGPIDTELGDGTVRAQAGLFDDPFFFDLDGFRATIVNLDDVTDVTEADLAFRSLMGELENDSFAGTNTMAIVLEMDAAAAQNGNTDYIQVWGTTGRAR